MIVVTGMHRSGTSMIASMLQEFGIGFGDPATFYQANEWNPKGYLEQREVIDLNSRLISNFPNTKSKLSKALSQVLYLLMPGPGTINRRAQALKEQMESLGTRYRSLAVKDPRFCVTLNAWASTVPIESTVVCIRHPWEVAHSLKRRQNIPLTVGLRFWNYHISSLLENLTADKSLLIHYNNLTGPEFLAELNRLLAFFRIDLSEAEAVERFRRVFSQELYHCREENTAPLPPTTEELWDRLIELYDSTNQ